MTKSQDIASKTFSDTTKSIMKIVLWSVRVTIYKV